MGEKRKLEMTSLYRMKNTVFTKSLFCCTFLRYFYRGISIFNIHTLYYLLIIPQYTRKIECFIIVPYNYQDNKPV